MANCYYYDQQGNCCKCYDNEALDELLAENAKLRERVTKLEELLPENGRWFRAETVEAYAAEIAKLRELVRDYHTFLALAELAQPIGSIILARGHPTLSVKSLDKRYRELGVDE